MTVKKSHLEVLFHSLKGTEGVLTLAESRIRDSFIKPVAEATETYFKDRTKIYETFCIKKEDGTPDFIVTKDKDGVDQTSYQFPPEKLEEINKELITLSEEEVSFEDNEKLKEILEKTEYKPKVGETALLDEVISKL